MLTNLDVYLSIAEESLAESERLDRVSETPRPDGQPGMIKRYDPEQRSFKSSMVAIAFAGMYFEALLYIVAIKRFGKSEAVRIDKKLYENRLSHFGIDDSQLYARCKAFREARKDLVHEKAVEITESNDVPQRTAQKVAKESVALIKEISSLLHEAP